MTARERLRAWIHAHTNQRQFAADIDIDETYVSQILSGVRTPRLPILAAIERQTGIPIGAWVPIADGRSAGRRRTTRKTANIGREKSRA